MNRREAIAAMAGGVASVWIATAAATPHEQEKPKENPYGPRETWTGCATSCTCTKCFDYWENYASTAS